MNSPPARSPRKTTSSGWPSIARAAAVLDEEGYETRLAGTGADPAGMTLANCPFHALAVAHTAVVCGMNLAIMEGLLAGLPRLGLTAVLDPAGGRCCARLANNPG